MDGLEIEHFRFVVGLITSFLGSGSVIYTERVAGSHAEEPR